MQTRTRNDSPMRLAGRSRVARPSDRSLLASALRCATAQLVLAAGLAALGLPAAVHAQDTLRSAVSTTRRLRPDTRIRKVVYQEDRVVPLVLHSFRVAVVEFAEDERVQTIMAGDSVAWEVKENEVRNRIFVKPRAEGAKSNVIVITDRRSYVFGLESRAEGDRFGDSVYRIRFEYPEEEAERAALRRRKEELKEQALINSGRTAASHANWRYAFAGDRSLVPEMIFDDGEATYFRFRSPADLPAIFIVDAAKKEAVANFRVEGPYVIVHRVAGQFALRVGDRLTCIFNEGISRGTPLLAVNGPREKGEDGAISAESRLPEVSAPLAEKVR